MVSRVGNGPDLPDRSSTTAVRHASNRDDSAPGWIVRARSNNSDMVVTFQESLSQQEDRPTDMPGDERKGSVATSPPWWRLCLGLLLAPVLPALLFAGWISRSGQSEETLFDRFMTVSVLGVYPTVLVCGVPALLVLRNRVRPTLPAAALAGGFVASLPWWIFAGMSGGNFGGMIGQTALPAFLAGLLGGAIFFLIGIAGSSQRAGR